MKKSRRRSESGLGLVELLVTIGVLTLVLGVIVNFFISQNRASAIQKAMNEANEAARIALSLITWDLQNAGYRVTVSNTNPAIHAPTTNVDSHADQMVVRYRNDTTATAGRYRYSIGGAPISLRRAEYADDPTATPTDNPTVASVVAMNLQFETRANQFVDVVGTGTSKSCPSGTTPFPPGATGAAIDKCSVNWVWRDQPDRLVRQIRVQLLARSQSKVSGYRPPVQGYTFTGNSGSTTYSAEPGYVYYFSEQLLASPNLGR